MSKLWRGSLKNVATICRYKNARKSNSSLSWKKYGSIGFGSGLFFYCTTMVHKDDIIVNFGGISRFFRSLKICIHISIDYYFSMMGLTESAPNYEIMMSRIHQRAADRILKGCLSNGGTYIKLGQGLVSLSHILPKEYVKTLANLQDKCLVRTKNELVELFLEDFGKTPEEIFKSFDREPLAAASLAQVFKARTFDDEVVAVKVQYIDLQKRFKSDVSTIKLLLKVTGAVHRNFNFAWILDDLVETLKQELDFVNEGKNAEKCAQDLKHFNYIYVPKIYWKYTTGRVLVMEFIVATKINDIKELKAQGFSLEDINKKLFESFGYQIFQTGFVHADPHPGNVMVRWRGRTAELVLLDHGLYQKISDEDMVALSHMWNAIVLNNHEDMKKYAKVLGVEDYRRFAEILTQSPLISTNFKLKVKLSEEDLKRMTATAKYRFDSIMACLQAMPRPLLLVIRNLNTIRAIAHDHGNPIDRYAILARCATQRIFQTNSLKGKIANMPKKIYFEFKLIINKVHSWIKSTIINTLVYLGLPSDIKMLLG